MHTLNNLYTHTHTCMQLVYIYTYICTELETRAVAVVFWIWALMLSGPAAACIGILLGNSRPIFVSPMPYGVDLHYALACC